MFVHDSNRVRRTGLPEAVLCEGKPNDVLAEIVKSLGMPGSPPALLTRLWPDQHAAIVSEGMDLDYDALSGTAFLNGVLESRSGSIGIITAGSSDIPVSREASRTLEYMGLSTTSYDDVGVAGLWRLQARLDEIATHQLLIVVAGMDAALVSVLVGLVPQPIVAVPTSTGYGTSDRGKTALSAALCSCAQGLTVVNIDNGFGAACAAVRMLNSFDPV